MKRNADCQNEGPIGSDPRRLLAAVLGQFSNLASALQADADRYKLPNTFWVPLIGLILLLPACAPDVVRHNNAGNEFYAEGAYEEAVAEYRQAQVDAPDRAEPYYNAANAFNRQEQLDAARAQAQQALKSADTALAAQTWYNLGNAYFDAAQWPQAVAAYQEALRLDSDDPDAKHNLELALQELEEQEQAQEQQQQQQDSQEDQRQAQPEDGPATPTPAGEPQPTQDGAQATPDPAGETGGAAEMTPQQAQQLLQAVIEDSQTLQERLQRVFRVPGPPPEQDW